MSTPAVQSASKFSNSSNNTTKANKKSTAVAATTKNEKHLDERKDVEEADEPEEPDEDDEEVNEDEAGATLTAEEVFKQAAENKKKAAIAAVLNKKNALNDMDEFETSSVDEDEPTENNNNEEEDEDLDANGKDLDESGGGDWVKVSNGHGNAEKKSKKNSIVQSISNSTSSTTSNANKAKNNYPVKVSSSLNSLDSFKEVSQVSMPSPLLAPQQQSFANNQSTLSLTVVKEDTSSSSSSSSSPIDMLIPNSLDEEEIMLRKALELSLKETKMMNENVAVTVDKVGSSSSVKSEKSAKNQGNAVKKVRLNIEKF